MGGDVVYRPTERTTVNLSTLRARQESTFGTTVFYVTSTATLSVTHQILPKLNLTARVGVGPTSIRRRRRPTGKRTSDTTLHSAGAQAEYDIQPWLRVGLEYLRISTDSNFPSFRFVDDRITARATVSSSPPRPALSPRRGRGVVA